MTTPKKPNTLWARVIRPRRAARASLRRRADVEALIDGGEHLIEAGYDDDLDEPFRAPLRRRRRLEVVGHRLPGHGLGEDRAEQHVRLACLRLAGADRVDDIRRQPGGERMLYVVMPFERRSGCMRDAEHDELVDRPRKHAIELQIEAELLDAPCQFGMVEERDIAPKPSPRALRFADTAAKSARASGGRRDGSISSTDIANLYSWKDQARAPALKS